MKKLVINKAVIADLIRNPPGPEATLHDTNMDPGSSPG